MPAPLTASGPAGKRLGVTAGNHQAASSNRGKAHAPTSLCATTWTPGGFGSSDLRVGVREGGRAVQLHRHTGISPQKRGACLHSSPRREGGVLHRGWEERMGFPCPQSTAHNTLAGERYRRAWDFTPQHSPFHWRGAGGTQASVPFKTSPRGWQAQQPQTQACLCPEAARAGPPAGK